MPTCATHPSVLDRRGPYLSALPVPPCETGADYGVWTHDDAGFICTFDCALQAGNYAAELMAEDDEQYLEIFRQCREHENEPADGCAECSAEED